MKEIKDDDGMRKRWGESKLKNHINIREGYIEMYTGKDGEEKKYSKEIPSKKVANDGAKMI